MLGNKFGGALFSSLSCWMNTLWHERWFDINRTEML